MAYTKHGHHIPGTSKNNPPSTRARCGGPGMCAECSRQASIHTDNYGPTAGFEPEILPGDNSANYPAKAMVIVKNYVDEMHRTEGPVQVPVYEIYVVMFAKVLTGWKAEVSTTLEDGMYYEVTYNGLKRETYLDVYKKRANITIPD